MTEFIDPTSQASVDYTLCDANGQVMSVGGGPYMPENLPDGLEAFPGHPPSLDYYRDGDNWVPIPEKPAEGWLMDWEAKAWYDGRDLGEAKAARWEHVKRTRDRAEFATFFSGEYEFDCDATSRARITGAVQLAVLDENYEVYWTLADNRIILLDAPDLLALAAVLGTFTAQLHAAAATMRIEIQEAQTLAELDALVWQLDT